MLYTISTHLSPSPSNLGRQSRWVACLLICVSGLEILRRDRGLTDVNRLVKSAVIPSYLDSFASVRGGGQGVHSQVGGGGGIRQRRKKRRKDEGWMDTSKKSLDGSDEKEHVEDKRRRQGRKNRVDGCRGGLYTERWSIARKEENGKDWGRRRRAAMRRMSWNEENGKSRAGLREN
jgi:hypothetical protein